MEEKQLGRRAELESMFNKFPHVPREPILQIDLYREGTTLPPRPITCSSGIE